MPDSSDPAPKAPKVGVIVGSGGIKTMAALPLFELLAEQEIEADLLVGCSGGGLLVSLIGAGYSPAAIRHSSHDLLDRKLFSRFDLRSALRIAKLLWGRFDYSSSLLQPGRLLKLYRELFEDRRLEDLRPQTVLQATDIETGEGIILTAGRLSDAVYASTAFYPYLPPIRIDGRWLVDGAFSASLPLMEAIKRNVDVILSVTVDCKPKDRPANLLQNYNYLLERMKTSYERSQIPLAIDLHHDEIVFINIRFDRIIEIWNIEQLPQIFAAGEVAVDRKREEILEVIRGSQPSA